jgi:hypothetical protein
MLLSLLSAASTVPRFGERSRSALLRRNVEFRFRISFQ